MLFGNKCWNTATLTALGHERLSRASGYPLTRDRTHRKHRLARSRIDAPRPAPPVQRCFAAARITIKTDVRGMVRIARRVPWLAPSPPPRNERSTVWRFS